MIHDTIRSGCVCTCTMCVSQLIIFTEYPSLGMEAQMQTVWPWPSPWGHGLQYGVQYQPAPALRQPASASGGSDGPPKEFKKGGNIISCEGDIFLACGKHRQAVQEWKGTARKPLNSLEWIPAAGPGLAAPQPTAISKRVEG